MTDLEIAIQAVRLYAETHPRPVQVNLSQAADMLGLSRPTVRKMIVSGKIRQNSLGLIPVIEIDRVLQVQAQTTHNSTKAA